MKLIQPIPAKIHEKLDKLYFIARLARPEQLALYGFNHEAVDSTPLHPESLQFIMKIVSPIPPELRECFNYDNLHFYGNERLPANMNQLNKFTGTQPMALEQRRQLLKKKMGNALFVVQMWTRENKSGESVYLKILTSDEQKELPDDAYRWIPSADASAFSEHAFDIRLGDDTRPVLLNDWFHPMGIPPFFMHGDSIYKGDLRISSNELNCTYYPKKDAGFRKIRHWLQTNRQRVVLRYAHLYAVSEKDWHQIQKNAIDQGVLIHVPSAAVTVTSAGNTVAGGDSPLAIGQTLADPAAEMSPDVFTDSNIVSELDVPASAPATTTASGSPATVTIADLIPGNLSEQISKSFQDLPVAAAAESFPLSAPQPLPKAVPAGSEAAFLQQLGEQLQLDQRIFSTDDLIKLHVSVKTNLLTILGGRAGTGKSELATRYAEQLGLKWQVDALFIPVSPVYSEPNDLLGYYHSAQGAYVESETGLARFLYTASLHPDRLFLVIFDEMNLSQVEHWFSPFISLMDRPPERRMLPLYSSSRVDAAIPPVIPLGPNVRMIGTVNVDETTKPFSDRLLDRVNLIHLQPFRFSEIQQRLKQKSSAVPKPAPITGVFSASFLQWLQQDPSSGLLHLLPHEVTLLERIHTLLQEHDPQRGISMRVIDGIGKFLFHLPKAPDGTLLMSRKTAFDWQLQQRVFSLLRGPETMIRPLVGVFETDHREDGALVRLLNSWEGQMCSPFDHSIAFLQRRAKELSMYGYI